MAKKEKKISPMESRVLKEKDRLLDFTRQFKKFTSLVKITSVKTSIGFKKRSCYLHFNIVYQGVMLQFQSRFSYLERTEQSKIKLINVVYKKKKLFNPFKRNQKICQYSESYTDFNHSIFFFGCSKVLN